MKKAKSRYNFWITWRNKTLIERKAIRAVVKARKLVIQSLPESQLVAIYLKGSFSRREMIKSSDVDMVPIVRQDEDEGGVWSVNDKKIHPVVVVPLSLSELRDNELHSRSSYHPDLRARPDELLRKIKSYKLIYGNSLKPKDFPIRSNKVALKDKIAIIQYGYIPAFKKKRIDFETLLKEVFWLTEFEQKVKGKKPQHSFQGITDSIQDQNHLIHFAYRFRTVSAEKKEKEAFIIKLRSYLKSLEGLV